MTIDKEQKGTESSGWSYSMYIERPKKNRSQKTLICLWVLTLLVICGSLYSTPYVRNAPIFGTNGGEGLFEILICFLAISIPCSWPLYFALRWSEKPNGSMRQVIFGISSVVIAGLFSPSIAFGHDAGVGLSIIWCALIIWATYPIFSPGGFKSEVQHPGVQ